MKPAFALLVVGLLVLPGCGSRRQVVRANPEIVHSTGGDDKSAPRVNNAESPTVQSWSTGGP